MKPGQPPGNAMHAPAHSSTDPFHPRLTSLLFVLHSVFVRFLTNTSPSAQLASAGGVDAHVDNVKAISKKQPMWYKPSLEPTSTLSVCFPAFRVMLFSGMLTSHMMHVLT